MKITESQLRQIIREELSSGRLDRLPKGFDMKSVKLPPGWHINPVTQTFENDRLDACISWDAYDNSWKLSSGYNSWAIRNPEQGFVEAEMP